jgi:hypothetical protein
MAFAIEAQLKAVMHQALALHAFAHAGFGQKIDRVLFEHTGAHTILNVLAGTIFDDNGFDAFAMEEMREEQPGGAGANDADLRAPVQRSILKRGGWRGVG